MPSFKQENWTKISPREAALSIAAFGPVGGRSLVEYFGVSKIAMARRLIEFGLVI